MEHVKISSMQQRYQETSMLRAFAKNFLLLLGLVVAGCAPQKPWRDNQVNPYLAPPRPIVALETTSGTMLLELYPDKSPLAVENFLRYVDEGFYDGTIFHRVIKDFVVQGGGLTESMEKKETGEPVANESDNGLRNISGSIAAARTSDPDSATSQFYINLGNNYALDARDGSPGYTVFGRVLTGLEIARRISQVPTHTVEGYEDVPIEPVLLLRAERQ
jgi:cyclophilin family peptidyl-prolyl cis-trans isomerase